MYNVNRETIMDRENEITPLKGRINFFCDTVFFITIFPTNTTRTPYMIKKGIKRALEQS